jgi:hypothetical protein
VCSQFGEVIYIGSWGELCERTRLYQVNQLVSCFSHTVGPLSLYISTTVEVDWVHVKYAVDVHQPDTEFIRNVLFHRYGTTHKVWIVELEYTDIPGDCRPSLRSPWRDTVSQ